jgi:hypothetical protein
VADILNFYYPHSEPHGSVGDLWVRTPKHDAKSLVKYSKHHPDLEFSHFVIPQVPGSMRRSKPVRGVLESLFRAKKYMVPLALFHPFIAGGVASVYLVGDRFNPARNAEVFSLTGAPEPPPTNDERQAYLKSLEHLAAGDSENESSHDAIPWRKFEAKAQPGLDGDGGPVLLAYYNDDRIELGVARSDLSMSGAPLELQQELMISRLKQALTRSRAPRTSSTELREDWNLLEQLSDVKQANGMGVADSASGAGKRAAALNSD